MARVGAPAPCCSVEGETETGGLGTEHPGNLGGEKGCKFGSFERKFSEKGRPGSARAIEMSPDFQVVPSQGEEGETRDRKSADVRFCSLWACNPNIDGRGAPGLTGVEPQH